MLKVAADGAIIDFVRYPYAPLEAPTPGPGGVLLASVRDLGAMKLSALSTRGIRRDFWDAFVMVKSGHSLARMASDFRTKFGKEASDLITSSARSRISMTRRQTRSFRAE